MLCPHIHVEAELRTDWRHSSKSLLYAPLYYLLLVVAFYDAFSKSICLQQQRFCHTKTIWQSFIIEWPCELTKAEAADAVGFSSDCI